MRRWFPALLLSFAFVLIASAAAQVLAVLGSSYFGEWQLVFQQMQSNFRWITLSLVCAVAVGLIAVLHEYERQLVSKPLGVGLLTLRLLLILIVFLTLLEPVWIWSYDQETLGRVVVAVDVSESMETADQHAVLEEKLRWARSLGMFNQGGSGDQIQKWIQDLQSGREPEWVSEEEEPNPLRRQQRAVARKDDLEATLQTVTEYSRLELALKVFVASSNSILNQLSEHAQTDVSIFATDHARADIPLLEGILAGQEIKLKRKSSDLAQPLNSALSTDSETPLAGIVVVSDGRDTSQNDLRKLIQRVSGLRVPVHTVLVGSEHRPRDLSISHVDAPETVFEEDAPVVKGIVHAFGFENQSITVALEFLDEPQRAPLQQVISVDKPAIEVAFTLKDLELGRNRFRISTEISELELRNDNNSRDFSLNVVDDRAHVLMLEGEGRWEFRFLHTALERDNRVAVRKILFDQPYLGILSEPFFDNRLTQLDPATGTATQFARFDCVLIGDVSPRHLSLADWRNLERYVREEGGTIVMTAGKRDFPFAYRGTIVDGLLPIENLRVIDLTGANQSLPPPERGFRISITPDGERHSMFQLGADWNESRRIWSQLPGHSWGITGDAKGGATVLASALSPGERLSLESERKNGIVVQHYVGSGQVIWLGVDSTWRWRYRLGDRHHHRFWGQLIRSAVGFKATSSNKNVRLALTQSVINEGESTRIQVRWDERFLQQHPQLKTVSILTATDGTNFRKRIDLIPDENRRFMHAADARDLAPGEYRVTLETPGIPWQDEPPETVLIVREETTEELADISADRAILEEIATQTGGRFLLLDEAQQLPELFHGTQEISSVREEIPLWSHWWILALFSLIATGEWVTRKINGLP